MQSNISDRIAPASDPTSDRSELRSILERAFENAIGMQSNPDKSLTKNEQRSKNWVIALRDEFHRAHSEAGGNVRVLCKGCRDNLKEFELTELLHDVLVCRVSAIPSRVHKKSLTYIKEALWQVESEFRSNGTETMKDFNKLILGSARCKLFVGPVSSNPEGDLDVLIEPAKCCQGDVFVAFVPSPYKPVWTKSNILLFCFDPAEARWVSL